MKRLITVLLSVLMIAAVIPFSAFAAGDEKEDWEIYENYLYYNNDGTKTSGYTIDKINFQTTDEYFGVELDASYFPEIADRIVDIEYVEFYEYNIIFRKADPEFSQKKPVYTEEDIDEYIGFLKYIKGLDFVLDIVPEKITIEPFDPLEDWEKYENYIDYNNDGTKGHGYCIDFIYVDISWEYLSENEVTPSTFPEIESRIVRIMPPSQYSSSQNRYRIDFKVYDPYVAHDRPVYTEEEIDEFIAAVKYINSLDFVISAEPEEVIRVELDEPAPLLVSEGTLDIYVDGVDESGKALSKKEKAYIAERYSNNASLIEGKIRDSYEYGKGIEWPLPGSGYLFEQNDPCEKYGHLLRYVRITAVRHCFFDTEPRCLECTYRVSYCERCSYYAENFDGPNGGIKRISCHSGTALKDWEIYDNYLHYGGASDKISGYVTDSATVYLTSNFAFVHDTVNPSDFPDIADRIDSVEYSKSTRTATVHFKEAGVSKDEIDDYIADLKYIESLSYVGKVVPNYRTEKYEPPAPAKEKEVKTEDPPAAREDITPRAAEPSREIPAAEPRAVQSQTPVLQSGAKAPALRNPPTGDEIYLLIFTAASSLFTVLYLIKKKMQYKYDLTEEKK